MSGRQTFICYPCGHIWDDTYTFWRGYVSSCPICRRERQALCDMQDFGDQREWRGLCDAPVFEDVDDDLKTEADLENERHAIHDEIAEAIGAMEADVANEEGDDGDVGAESDGV